VRWVAVASGLWSTSADLRDYEAQHAQGIPLLLDEFGDWFRAFDVASVPAIVIADAARYRRSRAGDQWRYGRTS
jgi:hypothetical protein